MDPPLSLLAAGPPPSAHALAAARLGAFAPEATLEPMPEEPEAGLALACAAAWDAAFGGGEAAVSPASLRASSAQLRASAVRVCEDMQGLCLAAARGEGAGGSAARGGDALQAFRAAVAGLAAQLEALRRQEALAEVVAHATGASPASGLRGAQASLDRLQLALQALPL